MNFNREGSEQSSSGTTKAKNSVGILGGKAERNVLETQMDDSVLVMPNGQDPWQEAQH